MGAGHHLALAPGSHPLTIPGNDHLSQPSGHFHRTLSGHNHRPATAPGYRSFRVPVLAACWASITYRIRGKPVSQRTNVAMTGQTGSIPSAVHTARSKVVSSGAPRSARWNV